MTTTTTSKKHNGSKKNTELQNHRIRVTGFAGQKLKPKSSEVFVVGFSQLENSFFG